MHHFEAANLGCLILGHNDPQTDVNIRPAYLGSWFLVGLLDPLVSVCGRWLLLVLSPLFAQPPAERGAQGALTSQGPKASGGAGRGEPPRTQPGSGEVGLGTACGTGAREEWAGASPGEPMWKALSAQGTERHSKNNQEESGREAEERNSGTKAAGEHEERGRGRATARRTPGPRLRKRRGPGRVSPHPPLTSRRAAAASAAPSTAPSPASCSGSEAILRAPGSRPGRQRTRTRKPAAQPRLPPQSGRRAGPPPPTAPPRGQARTTQ